MISRTQNLQLQAQMQRIHEQAWPAEIQLDDTAAPIACAGGLLSDVAGALGIGGFEQQFAVAFRVRSALLPGGLPEAGSIGFRWRREGETEWHPRSLLARASDPGTGTYILFGAAPPQ